MTEKIKRIFFCPKPYQKHLFFYSLQSDLFIRLFYSFTKIPLLFPHVFFSFIVCLLVAILALYTPIAKQILENRMDIFRKQNFSFSSIILDLRIKNLGYGIDTLSDRIYQFRKPNQAPPPKNYILHVIFLKTTHQKPILSAWGSVFRLAPNLVYRVCQRQILWERSTRR